MKKIWFFILTHLTSKYCAIFFCRLGVEIALVKGKYEFQNPNEEECI